MTSTPAEKGTWKQIDDDAGIKVWRLEIPGVEMPGFRGEVEIAAPAERIVEVLKQVEHHTEWMKNCVEARIIKRFGDDHTIVYNRTDAPWPIWDRDTVLDSQYTYEAERITLSFKNTDPKLTPLPSKVVRMPRLQGSYVLTKLGPSKTRVRYTVEADIGGSVPTWLATRVAKEMPYETLNRLRARVTGNK
ncbi:MAG TPA: START domain-containing protein [Polyangiales bacterium]